MTSTSTPQNTIPRAWYEDENERKAFIDLINIDGFLLEEAICEVVSKSSHRAEIHVGEVFEGAPHREKGRVEIDLWIKINNFVFLIESKRSDFDWVFLENQDSDKNVHLITGPSKTVSVHNKILPGLACVSKRAIEVLEDTKKPSLCKQSKGIHQQYLPLRSSREEYVHNALRQALYNMETLIHSHQKDPSWTGASHRIFIPLIVTNARLLSASYNLSDVDSNAILSKMELAPIQAAGLNHAEMLKWGPSYEKQLEHAGQLTRDQSWGVNMRYKGTHNKTVFVVTKDHVLDFINIVMLEIPK